MKYFSSLSGVALVGFLVALNLPRLATSQDLIVDGPPEVVFSTGTTTYRDIHVGESLPDSNLTVQGGAVLEASRQVIIGHGLGAEGRTRIVGTGSTLRSLDLYIGNSGEGVLQITEGGTAESIGTYVGGLHTGQVVISGNGSSLTTRRLHSVGGAAGAVGTVEISEGGVLRETGGVNTSNYTEIGRGTNSLGSVTVTGAGSQWQKDGSILLGWNGGTGRLRIDNGGQVMSNELIGANAVGAGSNSIGIVEVSGSGSSWKATNALAVGVMGTGSLEIKSGGKVTSGAHNMIWAPQLGFNTAGAIGGPDIVIGSASQFADARGTVTVTGEGSEWINNGNLLVGVVGEGILNVEAGGRISNESAFIGEVTGSHGTANVTGLGSEWYVDGDLYVGGNINESAGQGALNVADDGVVTVTGSTTIWENGQVTVATNGQINVADTVANEGELLIESQGAVSSNFMLNSGLIENHGMLSADVTTLEGGVLTGDGLFIGNITIGDLGTFSPGASPGTATTTNTTWASGGNYLWEIDALAGSGGTAGNETGWDLWHTGNLSIDGPFSISLATLDSSNNPGVLANWNESANDEWLIATSTNGAFSSLDFLHLDKSLFFNNFNSTGFSLRSSFDGSQLFLNYVGSGVSSVPEPSTVWLLLSGTIGIGALQRKNKRLRRSTNS